MTRSHRRNSRGCWTLGCGAFIAGTVVLTAGCTSDDPSSPRDAQKTDETPTTHETPTPQPTPLDSATPEAGSSEVVAPEVAPPEPEAPEPEAAEPEADKPEAAEPETSEPVAPESAREMVEGPDGSLMPVLERVELAGGLIVQTLRQGDGASCSLTDTITVHTHGTIAADGSVFWTTRGGEPATFALTALIPGWQQGVPGLRVGGVLRLTIPSALGYGDADRLDGAGNVVIPAGSDLIFTIELIAIQ